ncbi:hypothetical protein EV361DRAFT_934255 [Lentinula raphanica]|nr:hypothetical protein EV361DRAFT_934255 [Lentinula raphanica]
MYRCHLIFSLRYLVLSLIFSAMCCMHCIHYFASQYFPLLVARNEELRSGQPEGLLRSPVKATVTKLEMVAVPLVFKIQCYIWGNA